MKNLLRTVMIAALLLGCGSFAKAAKAQISFGIRIGPPPPVRVERRAPRPGPDYVWVPGYWYPDPDGDGHYTWHEGYWTRPPYQGAYWVPPRRENGEFYEGYWNGDEGRFEHNRQWDRDQNRDYNRFNGDRENNRNFDQRRENDQNRNYDQNNRNYNQNRNYDQNRNDNNGNYNNPNYNNNDNGHRDNDDNH